MLWVILGLFVGLILAIFLRTWWGQKIRKKYDVGGFASPAAVVTPREIFKRSLKDKKTKIKQQVSLISKKENRRKKR